MINVQAMVFGNMGGDSTVCVLLEIKTGGFILQMANTQGEDVVAGTHTPLPLNSHSTEDADANTLEKALPEVYKLLVELQSQLNSITKICRTSSSRLNKETLPPTNPYRKRSPVHRYKSLSIGA